MRNRALFALLSAFVLVLTGLAITLDRGPGAPGALALAASPQLEALCVAAYDGDTLTVKLDNGKTEKVRLLGVDTAEMAQGAWGERARDFTRRMAVGKRVRIVFDVQQRDRYGRLLGYVYTQDGTFLNLALIRQGYAMLLTYAPNVAHVEAFTAAQREARAAGRGIWSRTDGLEQSPRDFRRNPKRGTDESPAKASGAEAPGGSVSFNRSSRKYHAPGCRYAGCANCEPLPLDTAKAQGGVPCKVCH